MICPDRYTNTHTDLWKSSAYLLQYYGQLCHYPPKISSKSSEKRKPGRKWWATCCSPKTDIKTTVVLMTNEGVGHLQWTANKVFRNLWVRSNYFPDCIQKGIQPDEKFCSNHPPTSREQLANQTSRNITEKLVHKHVCCVGENIF